MSEEHPPSSEVGTSEETASIVPSQPQESAIVADESHHQQHQTVSVESDTAQNAGGDAGGAVSSESNAAVAKDDAESEPTILIEPATSGDHPPPELPSVSRDRAPTNTSAIADERMVAYDSPTMISDLETQLQFFIRPEFQLLEILCHVNGFVEDTTYLFVDLGKLMISIHNAEETPAPSRKAALVDFILPRLALKSDDVDLNRMKLIMYLQPFQKHTFTGEFGHEVSSSKFKEPPLFQQVIVDKPTGLDVTPWPTTIDSAALRAAETYLNHFHGADTNDTGSRRTSVRSSLFAKAWLGPNSPLQTAPSTRPSVMMIDAHLHGDAAVHGDDLISPTRLGSISISANTTGPLSLPKINKAGSISVDNSLNSSLNSRHADDLQSPSSVAASLASTLFNQSSSHNNNNNNNSSSSNSNGNVTVSTTASFLPRLVDPSPHGDGSSSGPGGGHGHPHHLHLHDRERRDSFAKDGPAGEKHIYDFLMSNESRCDSGRLQVDGTGTAAVDQQQQPPHHVTILPPLDDGHYTGSPLIASSAQNSARKSHFHHANGGNGTGGGAAGSGGGSSNSNNNNGGGGASSTKGNRDRLQRRSLGNANFAPPSSGKHGGKGNGGGPEDSPSMSVGSVKSVTGSPSRLLRRSFGMDPIQARSLESEKFGSTLPKLAPIAGNGTGNGTGAMAAAVAATAAPAAAVPTAAVPSL